MHTLAGSVHLSSGLFLLLVDILLCAIKNIPRPVHICKRVCCVNASLIDLYKQREQVNFKRLDRRCSDHKAQDSSFERSEDIPRSIV